MLRQRLKVGGAENYKMGRMPLDLTGCYAKIDRAKKHIAEFDKERVAFLDTNPFLVITEFNVELNATKSIMGRTPAIFF